MSATVLQNRVQTVAAAHLTSNPTITPADFIDAVLTAAVCPEAASRPEWARDYRLESIVYAEWEVGSRLSDAVRRSDDTQADYYRAMQKAIKAKQVAQYWFER
jgi:hypothetical protein